MKRIVLFVIFSIHFAVCRDFYVGMFKKNDLLVAQDYLYKEKLSYNFAYAKYGRKFKCPITYFRVVDRLGVGRGPQVKIIRGGLQKQYVVVRLTSPYNQPISVNIYVGCPNNIPTTPKTTKTTAEIISTTEQSNKTESTKGIDTNDTNVTNDSNTTDTATTGEPSDNPDSGDTTVSDPDTTTDTDT